MTREHIRPLLFILLLAGCLLPIVGTGTALAGGILFSLVLGNPWPVRTALWSRQLLQWAVVGLGFGLAIGEVWTVGRSSLGYSLVGIVVTLTLGWLLARRFPLSGTTAALIACGTAICGGSAIAALAPVLRSRDDETAVALATVFTLNAVALLLFPPLGHLFDLSQQQFGIWAALAIHDTSSVVGAAAAYGPQALATGTVVKLSRALWIAPLAFAAALYLKSEQRVRLPLFIVGFIAAASLHALLPQYAVLWQGLAGVARQLLVVTLFLIGAGLNRALLQRVGAAPLALGISLWLLVGSLSLAAICAGWI